jgi:hypothetical protein
MLSAPNSTLLRRIFILDGKLHPAWRVGLYLGLSLGGSLGFQIVLVFVYAVVRVLGGSDLDSVAGELTGGSLPPGLTFALTLSGLLWTLALTWAFRRWLDKAPFRALGLAGMGFWRDTLGGLLLGLASMAALLGLHLALGWAAITFPAEPSALGSLSVMILVLLPAAATEEIAFRGYLLQTVEGWRGWRLGVIVSSLLFGLAHALNPGVTALALANIALAGVVFALVYRLTRRLWFVIAYHFMWNYAQGPLLGFPVSGLTFGGWAQTRVAGPALWTGGAFGPEGGLLVTLLLITTGLGLWGIRTRVGSDQ